MTWLVWRQHRWQLLFGVAGLIVFGAFFLATGLPIHDRFEEAGLPDCLPETIDSTVVANLYDPIATEPVWRRLDRGDHPMRPDRR